MNDLNPNQQRLVKHLEANKAFNKESSVSLGELDKKDKDDLLLLRKLKIVKSTTEKATTVYWLNQECTNQEQLTIVSAKQSPEFNADFALLCIEALKMEITDLTQQNEALKKEIELLRSQTPAIWMADQESDVEYAILSSCVRLKSNLDEIMKQAEAEVVKYAKPRTIYKVIKHGVMTPSVLATFNEVKS